MSFSPDRAFAGDMSVEEAYQTLADDPAAVMIDVRTEPECQYVGAPDLSGLGKSIVFLPWQVYPSMQVLPNFVDALTAELGRRGAKDDAPLLFLCRSGVRSRAAAIAMTRSGWTRCYNIAGGFEGPLDDRRRRGRTEGWQAKGLPWAQS